MILVRETTRGQVQFDFGPAGGPLGESAEVYLIDSEGWTQDAALWHSRLPDEGSLAKVLIRAAQLPEDEAERLAEEVLTDWRERGADHMSRGERFKAVGPMIALLSILPLVVLGLLVWLLVILL